MTVKGTHLKNKTEINGVEQIRMDLLSYDEIKSCLDTAKPDVVVHTAAISDANYCQENKKRSRQINTISAAELAGLCADRDVRFAHISSDLVFDGNHPFYDETSELNPISFYGEQKAEAESEVRSRNDAAIIFRLPLMYGDAPAYSRNFFGAFIKSLKVGERLSLFTDEYRTPTSSKTASESILQFIDSSEPILHLGGPERISRYDFGILMCEILKLDADLIDGKLQSEVPMPAPRPKDISFDISKAQALGYKPLSLKEEFEDLKGIM